MLDAMIQVREKVKKMSLELEQAEAKIKSLEEKLRVAKDALKKVNQSELNSMRHGGGFSESARISYQALKEIEGVE